MNKNDLWEYTPDTVTAVEELESHVSISIYPNPSEGKFQLTIDNGQFTNAEIEIYNARGEKIKDIASLQAGSNVHCTFALPFREGGLAVDLSHQPAGVYFVRLATAEGHTASARVVKW
jgi:hypothetical protein